jgi:hypothetical protein
VVSGFEVASDGDDLTGEGIWLTAPAASSEPELPQSEFCSSAPGPSAGSRLPARQSGTSAAAAPVCSEPPGSSLSPST